MHPMFKAYATLSSSSGILSERLENVAREKDVWVSLLRLQPP